MVGVIVLRITCAHGTAYTQPPVIQGSNQQKAALLGMMPLATLECSRENIRGIFCTMHALCTTSTHKHTPIEQ